MVTITDYAGNASGTGQNSRLEKNVLAGFATIPGWPFTKKKTCRLLPPAGMNAGGNTARSVQAVGSARFRTISAIWISASRFFHPVGNGLPDIHIQPDIRVIRIDGMVRHEAIVIDFHFTLSVVPLNGMKIFGVRREFAGQWHSTM